LKWQNNNPFIKSLFLDQ